MTQEEKDLLLKDLCARLPYGVKFMYNKNIYTIKGLDLIVTDEGDWEYAVTAKDIAPIEIDFIKPYLFPLSSMTEEEWEDYQKIRMIDWVQGDINGTFINAGSIVDWLNTHHFDYRGLIEKGLAIDATGLNIYIKDR